MADKKALRAAMRKAFAALPANKKQTIEEALCRYLLSFEPYQNANVVLGYAATGRELSVTPLLCDALEKGKSLYLPRCTDPNGSMKFVRVRTLSELSIGMYGIPEPTGTECLNGFPKNAVILVPGLAFSPKGGRLGQGKGYYDRFLSKNDAISVGICYNQSVLCTLPCEEHDVSVRYLVTESGIFRTDR